jgi:hypothetical protein
MVSKNTVIDIGIADLFTDAEIQGELYNSRN